MRAAKSGKVRASPPGSVGVIACEADLDRALRLRRPPDLFELRLDALYQAAANLEASIAKLRAPLILTARHPAEGGLHSLATAERRALLLRFLPYGEFVDIELRSVVRLDSVLSEAARRNIRRIISIHDFKRTPPLRQFERLADRAQAARADVFKLVTRADTPTDLARLIGAFEILQTRLPVSAMGVGKLGRESRLELAGRGSVLNYAHFGSAQVEGQLSLNELHRLMRAR